MTSGDSIKVLLIDMCKVLLIDMCNLAGLNQTSMAYPYEIKAFEWKDFEILFKDQADTNIR